MVNNEKEIARVAAKAGEKLETVLTRGLITRGGISERTARKRLLVNGVSKRLVDFAGILKTVIFRPQDMDLVTESPTLRRKFMDTVLAQVDREYHRATLSYEKGLRRRNKLLFRIREEGISRSHLFFWDKLLIKNGDYITKKREELIDFINETEKLGGNYFRIEYDKSVISESRIEQYKREEVAAATTLVGPHRDDMVFFDKERDLAKYGSRGEQRMAVLWLKIAELSFIEDKTKEKPTLLLDDIFSELDHEHRKLVMDLANNQQTIISTADPHYLEFKKEIEQINLGM
jgi:DNA replication and repair protein RecF